MCEGSFPSGWKSIDTPSAREWESISLIKGNFQKTKSGLYKNLLEDVAGILIGLNNKTQETDVGINTEGS